MLPKGFLTLAGSCLLLLSPALLAAEHRIGVGAVTAISQFHDVNHHRVRLMVPWKWQGEQPWQPESVEFAVGVLRRNGEAIQTYSAGPLWRRSFDRCTCYLEGGLSVAYLNATDLRHPHNGLRQDFGYQIEFVTRVSVGFRSSWNRDWAIAFSVQHISNGGLGWTNPGADFIGAEIERRF